MGHMKMAIICIAAAALLLAAGAGSASAAVLCKENNANCKANIYPSGTQLVGGSASNMLFKTIGGVLLDECSGHSTFKAKTSNNGGPGDAVKAPLSEWTWATNCTKTTKTVANGEFTFDSTSTNGNGTITLHGFEVTLLLGAGDCIYGSSSEPDVGTVIGGKTAEAKISVILKKTGGPELCSTEVRWEVIYNFTEPAGPIWVEPGGP